jgi:DNA repair protein RecN (Recombination protein N)
MLEELRIRNLAVIESADIPFGEGLNILSGETGAGKSIVINAIALLLGAKSSSDWVRQGEKEAAVEGLFRIQGLDWLKGRLSEEGLWNEDAAEEMEEDGLIVRRTIQINGRSRITINGSSVTRAQLKRIAQGLVDLCGQHEHQSLLDPTFQLRLVDRFGGLDRLKSTLNESLDQWRALAKEIADALERQEELTRKKDFLEFQKSEIEAAQLQPGEEKELKLEKKLLQSAERRLQLSNEASSLIGLDAESGVLDRLSVVRQRLAQLSEEDGQDKSVREMVSGVQRAIAELEEVDHGLNGYLARIEMDPDRLDQIAERLSEMNGLKRKYGESIEAVLETLERVSSELSQLESFETDMSTRKEEEKKLKVGVGKQVDVLSKKRRNVSKTLAQSVTSELADLKMADAQFEIEWSSREAGDWVRDFGGDELEFIVQTNRGEKKRPLGKIASGGELSRILLSIRRVIADRGTIGVYLFDEIDSGMGGQTAFSVGRKLKSVSEHNQVICITHLPQVAAFADHHLLVVKSSKQKKTHTDIVRLPASKRKNEIARMLGGDQISATSLKNASELMKSAEIR